MSWAWAWACLERSSCEHEVEVSWVTGRRQASLGCCCCCFLGPSRRVQSVTAEMKSVSAHEPRFRRSLPRYLLQSELNRCLPVVGDGPRRLVAIDFETLSSKCKQAKRVGWLEPAKKQVVSWYLDIGVLVHPLRGRQASCSLRPPSQLLATDQ